MEVMNCHGMPRDMARPETRSRILRFTFCTFRVGSWRQATIVHIAVVGRVASGLGLGGQRKARLRVRILVRRKARYGRNWKSWMGLLAVRMAMRTVILSL